MWQLFWPGVTALAVTVSALLFRAALVRALRQWLGPTNALHVLLGARALPLDALVHRRRALRGDPDGRSRAAAAAHGGAAQPRAGSGGHPLGHVHGGRRARRAGDADTERVFILVIGGLILLDVLGVKITPLLTALGVGGLAVALALQDSLSNLFAGVHLLADRPIRVGDYVKIADSIEGFVVDVGWRSTRVRTLGNNVVIVPNKRVAESIIVNYDMPERRMSLAVPVSVAYGSDPDGVEAVVVDEAKKAAAELTGLLADPPPAVRLIPGFGLYGLDFTLSCQVASFVDQYAVQHELRKRVLRRLHAEGIALPYPIESERKES